MASKRPAASKQWKVKKVSEYQATITLPKGMKFTGRSLSIEDIIDAVNRHAVITEGGVKSGEEESTVVVRCCGGNTALA